MIVEKRMKMIQMIEKVEKNKKFSEKLGIKNVSHLKEKTEKKN